MVSYHDTTATFTPSGYLSAYTTYTARITTGVKDLAGNAMASLYAWSFMTTGDVDFTTPAVSSTNPANGAAGVDVGSIITATFSEEMDASTITADTFTVNNGSSNISGTVSYNDTTATFTPSANLPPYTTITARITTGVRDLIGNALASDYAWSFTTTGDFAAPTVSSTSPANGAASVDVGSIITATFSEEVDASTITADTFIVNNGSSNISGTVSYSDTIAAFTPSANLDFNTIYTAMLTPGVKDLAGNQMASAYTWSFTTGSLPATPTPTPTGQPTATPTPGACNAEEIKVSPRKLWLKKAESDTVMVTLTGEGDCPVEGVTVEAKVVKGKGLISVSPESTFTNVDGQAGFTITALKKTGNSKVRFKTGNIETILRIRVR
jgi:methionine-rich copper-binding protein CopC